MFGFDNNKEYTSYIHFSIVGMFRIYTHTHHKYPIHLFLKSCVGSSRFSDMLPAAGRADFSMITSPKTVLELL